MSDNIIIKLIGETNLPKVIQGINKKVNDLKENFTKASAKGTIFGNVIDKVTSKAKKQVAVTDKATESTSKLADMFGATARKGGTLGEKMEFLIGNITALVTAAAAIAKPLFDFGKFEQKMVEVKAITGATVEQFKALIAIAMKMGAVTVHTAVNAADGLKYLSMAGLNVIESITALPSVLDLATVGMLSLGTAADIATNVMTGMGLIATDLAHVTDVLGNTFTSSNTTLEELGTAMAYAAPLARAMNVSIDESIAALGLLGNAGIKACYDRKTDVLTKEGWKKWEDATIDDIYATENPDTGFIEYQKATEYIRYHYTGDMYKAANKGINLCVTPEHRMWVKPRAKDNYKVIRATDIAGKTVRYQTGGLFWEGTDPTYYKLPGISQNKGNRTEQILPIAIDINVWAAFLGWYLAEGSCYSDSNGNYKVQIAQIKPDHIKKMKEVLGQMPFKVRHDPKYGFIFHSQQLYQEMKKFGHCYYKYIPEYAKEWNPELLKILFVALLEGDGDQNKTYYTTSVKLKDDVQEIALKLGYATKVTCRNHAGDSSTTKDGRIITATVDQWKVMVTDIRTSPWYTPYEYTGNHGKCILGNRHEIFEGWIPYDDEVFCAVVPNGLLIVRREGRAIVSGNSRAGTTFRGILARLADPPRKAAAAMDMLGQRIGQSTIFVKDAQGEHLKFIDIVRQLESAQMDTADAVAIFGRRAGPGMLAIVNQGSQAFLELADANKSADGKMREIAETMQSTLFGQLKILWSKITALSILFGETLSGSVKHVINVMQDFFDGISVWISNNKELSNTLIKVAATISLIALGLGGVTLGARLAYLAFVPLINALKTIPAILMFMLNPMPKLIAMFGALTNAVITLRLAFMVHPVTAWMMAIAAAGTAAVALYKIFAEGTKTLKETIKAREEHSKALKRGATELDKTTVGIDNWIATLKRGVSSQDVLKDRLINLKQAYIDFTEKIKDQEGYEKLRTAALAAADSIDTVSLSINDNEKAIDTFKAEKLAFQYKKNGDATKELIKNQRDLETEYERTQVSKIVKKHMTLQKVTEEEEQSLSKYINKLIDATESEKGHTKVLTKQERARRTAITMLDLESQARGRNATASTVSTQTIEDNNRKLEASVTRAMNKFLAIEDIKIFESMPGELWKQAAALYSFADKVGTVKDIALKHFTDLKTKAVLEIDNMMDQAILAVASKEQKDAIEKGLAKPWEDTWKTIQEKSGVFSEETKSLFSNMYRSMHSDSKKYFTEQISAYQAYANKVQHSSKTDAEKETALSAKLKLTLLNIKRNYFSQIANIYKEGAKATEENIGQNTDKEISAIEKYYSLLEVAHKSGNNSIYETVIGSTKYLNTVTKEQNKKSAEEIAAEKKEQYEKDKQVYGSNIADLIQQIDASYKQQVSATDLGSEEVISVLIKKGRVIREESGNLFIIPGGAVKAGYTAGLAIIKAGIDKIHSLYDKSRTGIITIEEQKNRDVYNVTALGLEQQLKLAKLHYNALVQSGGDGQDKQKEKVDKIQKEITDIYQEEAERRLDYLKTQLDKALDQEQKYADELRKVKINISNENISYEDKVRKIKQESMSDEMKNIDILRQSQEKLRAGEDALREAKSLSYQIDKAQGKEKENLIAKQKDLYKLSTDSFKSAESLSGEFTKEIDKLRILKSSHEGILGIQKSQELAAEQGIISSKENVAELQKAIETLDTSMEKINKVLGDLAKKIDIKLEVSPESLEKIATLQSEIKDLNTAGEKALSFEVNDEQVKTSTENIKKANEQLKIFKEDAEKKGTTIIVHSDKALTEIQKVKDLYLKTKSYIESHPITQEIKSTGGGVGRATGGSLPGYGGGDIIPSMLEPGEWVIRKEAVKKYGSNLLSQINSKLFSPVSAFKTGGNVSAPSNFPTIRTTVPQNILVNNYKKESNILKDFGTVQLDMGKIKIPAIVKKDTIDEINSYLRKTSLMGVNS